jgi:purine-nucleoside phosphorylase
MDSAEEEGMDGRSGLGEEAADATLEVAAAFLRAQLLERTRLLIVAGSGLGSLSDGVEGGTEILFESIPGYPRSTVVGHAGSYLAGMFAGVPVLVQRGRYHFYEGHSRELVTLPVRVAAKLGVERLILTNAAGGIRSDLVPGTIVLLQECLDFQRDPPLPPSSHPFDPQFQITARQAAEETEIALSEGRYAGVLGPSFETSAEIRMLADFGADVVGMSTIAETATANQLNLSVLGLSLVTNRAAGLGGGVMSHEEVLRGAEAGSGDLTRLLRRIVERLPPS